MLCRLMAINTIVLIFEGLGLEIQVVHFRADMFDDD
jgi:hypothetical protein